MFEISFDKPYFFIDGEVTGKVNVDFDPDEILSLYILVLPSEYWQIQGHKGFSSFDRIRKNIDITKARKSPNGNEYEIPFSVYVGPNFQPCLELDLNSQYEAHNRYEFKFYIESTEKNTERNLYVLLLQRPVFKKDLVLFKETNQNVKNYFFFDKGEVGLKVFLPDINMKYNTTTNFISILTIQKEN